ncbi:MAG: hypothetical protein ACPG8W_11490 [Candidatus Promineifilaceae bacterium]
MSQIDLHTLLDLVGTLKDSSKNNDSASERFRSFLNRNINRADDIRPYITASLENSGDQFNKALQDLLNHLGCLLGFDVEFGRYRGVRGEIGFDGLWYSPTGLSIVVEAKTSDVFSVKTAPVLGYINSLVSEKRIKKPEQALGLYIYGRFDSATNQLENAIIVEGRREKLRVISAEALLNILELKENYRLAHNTILRLLIPAPVKADDMVNLIFDIVAKEKGDTEDTPSVDNRIPKATPSRNNKKRRSNLVSIGSSYTGRTPARIELFKQSYDVQTWKGLTLTVLEVNRQKYPSMFANTALKITGRKRSYISLDADELRKPTQIPNTELFLETNLSANSMVQVAITLLVLLGHSASELKIVTTDKK